VAAIIIPFADVRTRKILQGILNTQDKIDQAAHRMFDEQSVEDLPAILDELEAHIDDLERTQGMITKAPLRKRAEALVSSYRAWEKARLGSPEERVFAQAYLSKLGAMEQFIKRRKS